MNGKAGGRIVAELIAVVSWVGLIIQWLVLCSRTSSPLHALWIMSEYFTISTNVLVALVFTAIALNQPMPRSGSVIAGTVLSILLVGVIYALLLHGLVELSGGSAVANVLLHRVTPLLVALFWIMFAPKGELRWGDPFWWAIYPLAYLGYALLRGRATGSYPYPFLNVSSLGWAQTAINASCIAVGFMISGLGLVWADHLLARGSSRRAEGDL